MLSLEQLSLMVKEHLGLYSAEDGISYSAKWIIAESALGGRGLFATDDIASGEVLFVDHSLIQGPRSRVDNNRSCTVCSSPENKDFFKCTQCALLLCSEECRVSDMHYNDCSVIKRWSNKVLIEEVDDTIMSRTLTAIRALLLNDDQKQFMASLQAHVLPQHGSEIKDLENYFDIPVEEVQVMTLACCVLDANAFQIAIPYGKNYVSKRGLFPVSALMNHTCVPNTRHSFNKDGQMCVTAVKPISAGAEIFTCYSGLLWGTPARRMHLFKTKHFWCVCERCADVTERGTFLSALKCFSSECPGPLMPADPLKPSSAWRCLECDMRVPFKSIATLQSALGSLMGSLNFENVDEFENFLINRIHKYIPQTNQITVDLQCRLIWEFGEAEGLSWQELSGPRLQLKEALCRDTLGSLAALGVGDAHLRGLLLYHLHAALAERARRCPALYEELKSEIESTIDQAYRILRDDLSSPPDLELRRRYLGPDCDKPLQERFCILNA